MPRLEKNILFDGRYLLLSKLGAGGFSEVWLVHDNKADIDVALKVFAPDKGMDDNGIQVFSKEFSLVFNLNHSNLLKPSHFDDFDGSPYLILPYCKNGSALDKIGEMTEHELGKFMLNAASALDYLHDQNPPIIHQDIKPDNFLIDDKGNYLLSDFGISSRIKRVLTRSVGKQNSSGTLPYMPPERFTKDRQIIKASDIFSLGVTFFELLTGDLPFGEHGGLLLNTGAEIPNLPSKFSPELNSLIESCLSKEPWNRPVAEQLKNVAQEYLKTRKWDLSLTQKDVPPAVTIETNLIVEPTTENLVPPKIEVFPPSVLSEKQPTSEDLIPPKNKGRKTEQMGSGFPVEETAKQSEPMPAGFSKPAKKKTSVWPFILAGVILLLVVVVVVIKTQIIIPKREEPPKISDSASLAEKKKAEEDSLKLIGDEKKKQDSLLTLKDKDKNDKKENNLTAKTEDQPKIELPSVDCNGDNLSVSKVNSSNYATWNQAVTICQNLVLYGYNDWYLPSKDELNCLFENQNNIGGFGSHDFWASTSKGEFASSQNFGDGHYYPNTLKDGHAYVRCVRK